MKSTHYLLCFLFIAIINYLFFGLAQADDKTFDMQAAEKTYGQIKDLSAEACLFIKYTHIKFVIADQLMRLNNVSWSTDVSKLPDSIQTHMREIIASQLYLSELKEYYQRKYGKPVDLSKCEIQPFDPLSLHVENESSLPPPNLSPTLPGWNYVNDSLLCDQKQGPSKDECYKLIKDLKSVLPNPWHIYGDFNGDKINDEAGLLINQKGERRLYAFLGKPQGSPEAVLLHDVGKLEDVDIYVALVEPGASETYCADSPDECEPNEPKTVNTKNPRIAFGLFEATQTDFYWNDKTKKFESIGISD